MKRNKNVVLNQKKVENKENRELLILVPSIFLFYDFSFKDLIRFTFPLKLYAFFSVITCFILFALHTWKLRLQK